MKKIIALAFGLALVLTTAGAQSSTPAPVMGSGTVNANKVVRRPVKNTKSARYRGATPVTAGDPNGVRINSAGEVLFDNP